MFKHMGIWIGGCVIASAFGLSVAQADDAKDKPGIEAKAAFGRLKSLAGDWKAASGHHGDGSVIYKVTAAGSALMETQFPGSDHEMVSMYHLDGDNLLMTHYCAAQNQPKLKLNKAKSTADTLVFDFDGGTNFDPAKDIHIHSARIMINSKDKITSEWDAFNGGKKFHTETFTLSR